MLVKPSGDVQPGRDALKTQLDLEGVGAFHAAASAGRDRPGCADFR
jgi:hypothetical protein